MKSFEVKEGSALEFVVDGPFWVKVVDGKTVVGAIDNPTFGLAGSKKEFEHDCDECVYMGTVFDGERFFDMYLHRSEPSIVARYGNGPTAYYSGLTDVKETDSLIGNFAEAARKLGLRGEER